MLYTFRKTKLNINVNINVIDGTGKNQQTRGCKYIITL